VSDSATAVQRLVDIEAIKQLKARYFRLVDAKDWDAWGQVFAIDAVLEIPEGDLVHRGRDDIVANVSTVMESIRTVHHGHMPEIELTGPDTARGVWAMFDYVEWPEQDGRRIGIKGYGHYVEEYVREDGEWRIARSRLERLRVDSLD
jgi:uncharacterized protein (TIGR02246 family)